MISREIDEISKQKNQHSETIKLLDNEINKCKLHIENLESEVATIMDQFEIAKNALNQLVCLVIDL